METVERVFVSVDKNNNINGAIVLIIRKIIGFRVITILLSVNVITTTCVPFMGEFFVRPAKSICFSWLVRE